MQDILLRNIDSLLGKEGEERNRLSEGLIGMILEPLREGGVAIRVLEHVDVEFREHDVPAKPDDDPSIVEMKVILKAKLGEQVAARINLSLTKERVNIFAGGPTDAQY